MDVLVVTLGGHAYALPVAQVKGVLRDQAEAPLPQAPPGVTGLIAIRGRALAVLDLGARLGTEAGAAHGAARRLVIVRLPRAFVALRVDGIEGVVSLPAGAARAVSELVPIPCTRAYVTSIAYVNDRMIVVLDPAVLLSDDETRQLAQPHPAAP